MCEKESRRCVRNPSNYDAKRHQRCTAVGRALTLSFTPSEGVEVRVREEIDGLKSLHSLELFFIFFEIMFSMIMRAREQRSKRGANAESAHKSRSVLGGFASPLRVGDSKAM